MSKEVKILEEIGEALGNKDRFMNTKEIKIIKQALEEKEQQDEDLNKSISYMIKKNRELTALSLERLDKIEQFEKELEELVQINLKIKKNINDVLNSIVCDENARYFKPIWVDTIYNEIQKLVGGNDE